MHVFWKYWLLQVPGWFILVALLVAARRWFDISIGLAIVVFVAWLVKDVVLYPILKHAYHFHERGSEDSLLGLQGVAQETLDRTGYVRVRGELWRAELATPSGAVPKGERVVVAAVDGLTLKVRAEG